MLVCPRTEYLGARSHLVFATAGIECPRNRKPRIWNMSFELCGGLFLARHLHAILREGLRLRGRVCGMRRCRRGKRSVMTRLRSRGMRMRGRRVLVNLEARQGCHSCCLDMYSTFSLCLACLASIGRQGERERGGWRKGMSSGVAKGSLHCPKRIWRMSRM